MNETQSRVRNQESAPHFATSATKLPSTLLKCNQLQKTIIETEEGQNETTGVESSTNKFNNIETIQYGIVEV